MYYGIDEIGVVIWAALEEPRTLDYLRETISRGYRVDKETCSRDVIDFLAEMQSAGLIDIDNAAA